jgi:GTPase SAR1 family protein
MTSAGAERYRAITTSHIRNADGAFLVYDVTAENSFNSLDFWYDLIRKATNDDIVIYLLGNKCDIDAPHAVSTVEAIEYVRRFNLDGYGECSAKENINVQESFKACYKSIQDNNCRNL